MSQEPRFPGGAGPGAVDGDRFRDAMSELASGLAVLTAAQYDGRPRGLLVASIASYSTAPPSVMAAIARASRSHDAIADGERFGVHLLRGDQEDLAHRFAGSTEDKFEDVRWEWDEGVPRLVEALTYLPCLRRAAFPHGDHTIVVGEAIRVAQGEGEPLIYLRRRMDWRPGRCAEDQRTIAPERSLG